MRADSERLLHAMAERVGFLSQNKSMLINSIKIIILEIPPKVPPKVGGMGLMSGLGLTCFLTSCNVSLRQNRSDYSLFWNYINLAYTEDMLRLMDILAALKLALKNRGPAYPELANEHHLPPSGAFISRMERLRDLGFVEDTTEDSGPAAGCTQDSPLK